MGMLDDVFLTFGHPVGVNQLDTDFREADRVYIERLLITNKIPTNLPT
jgi:hypothetical protein